MPLDANKIAHIQSVIPKTYTGRQKTVVLVYQNPGGSGYTYTAVSVIFRPQEVIEPEIPNLAGAPPRPQYDMLMVAPVTIDFTKFATQYHRILPVSGFVVCVRSPTGWL